MKKFYLYKTKRVLKNPTNLITRMSNTEVDTAQKVIQWIEENNGYWNSDSLEIKKSKFGGVGVFAKQDLDPIIRPIVLLRLHKQSILSFQKSLIANLITEEGIQGALSLVISFIYEKKAGKSSPWHTFISSIQYKDTKGNLILPPTLWTKKQKEILKGTELDIMGALDDQENQDAYERACTFALNQHELSNGSISIPWEFDIEGVEAEEALNKYKTFIAISHAIASRDFEIDEHHQVGLVPGACLFNHSNKPTVRFESLFDVCVSCGKSDDCEHIPSSDNDADDENDEVDSDSDDEDHEHGHSHSHSHGNDHGHNHTHGDEDEHSHAHSHGEDSGSDEEFDEESEDESEEEEFEGPIEEFIDVIEASIAREQEDELNQDNEEDSDLELEDEIVITEDDKPVLPDDCCDIVLMKKVSKGEELFNTYGDFSNSVLLSKYGFVIPDNTNDVVGLGIQFLRLGKNNKKLYSKQFEWWEREGYLLVKDYLSSKKNNSGEDHEEDGCTDGCCGGDDEDKEEEDIPDWTIDASIDYSGEPTPVTYALLKLLSLNKLELTKFLKNPEKVNLDILTTKSTSALKIFKQLVEARAKEYNNEINSAKLLKSSNEREKLAAQLIEGEKAIIARALEFVSRKI